MSTEQRIATTLTLDGVRRASAESSGKLHPPLRYYLVAVGALFALSMYLTPFLSFPLIQLFPMGSWVWVSPILWILPPVLVALFGLVKINDWYNRHNNAAFEKKWDEWGAPRSTEAEYSVSDAGFAMHTDRGEFLAYWCSVPFVQKVSTGWIVSSDLNNYFLPSDAFPDIAAERAFIAAICARLTPEAAGRSANACAFAKEDGEAGASDA